MDEKAKKVYKVIIHGREYPIRSDEKEEYVLKVANYVDSKMKDISDSSRPFPSPTGIAVLAALNIADELFKIKFDQQDVSSDLLEHISFLSQKLGQVLTGSSPSSGSTLSEAKSDPLDEAPEPMEKAGEASLPDIEN
ncbi:cell division protein ZapA [bacterium]|nr:cell division protein ZapA [bacterium]